MDELCLPCQDLFTRGPDTPGTGMDLGTLDSPFQRYGKDVRVSASSGCQFCVIVWAKLSTCSYRLPTHRDPERIRLSPNLHGSREAFTSIVYWAKDDDGNVYPEMFHINLYPESDVDTTAGRQRPAGTESGDCRSLAAAWILECFVSHEKCRTGARSNWLPRRLIDVGHGWPTLDPRLVLTSNIARESIAPLYTVLSHLWAAESVLRLTTVNQDTLVRRIPLASMSVTFRDAISFTRDIGIRYIWIDSLCILQDSAEDWFAESSTMNKVYQNSFCNIAGTAASESSPGLYQRRDPRLVTPYRVRIQCGEHQRTHIYSLGDTYFNQINAARLNTRGWVFQERMLSPRTLYFSSQLVWECRTLQACETHPGGLPRPPIALMNDPDRNWENCKEWAKEIASGPDSCWAKVVGEFCKTDLTRPTDRLAAVAGMAREMQSHTNDVYLAGLWKSHLPVELCWSSWGSAAREIEIKRPKEHRCPSWSWASLEFSGSIHIEFLAGYALGTQLAKVLDEKIESPTGNPFTHVSGGHLLLQGKIGQVNLDHLGNAAWRGDRGGHWTYEFHLDLLNGPDQENLADYEDCGTYYCFPITAFDRSNPATLASLQVFCLLLERAEFESMVAFKRVGWIAVLFDWEDDVVEELRWIIEYAGASLVIGQDTISLV